jgi:hypothetical protein
MGVGHAALREAVHLKVKRNRQLNAAILASQSVETVEGGADRGYDVGKKVIGCKQYVMVDTQAGVPLVPVTATQAQGRALACHFCKSAV